MALNIEINTALDKEGCCVVIAEFGDAKVILLALDAVEIGQALIQAGMAGKITQNTLEDKKHG